jgi:WD40 repeat protein/serine/threonine protein kinase
MKISIISRLFIPENFDLPSGLFRAAISLIVQGRSVMTGEQMEIMMEIFDTALGLAPEERDQYLRAACAGDEGLQARIEQLLLRREEAGDFLEQPVLPDPSHEAFALAGRHIGPYKLLRELGHGGMAIVYLAIRADDVYQKEVAVKLVWPGMERTGVIRRFKQERRILARLDHPNIARLLDGGATEEGWPYVVMEYVDGAPITEYCDQRRLNISERLRLFRTVCAAVAYAHRNLIVHRDLKPGNIFVTADGTVKLLDFGIAKLLDPESQLADLTQTGLHLLTPEYASPEQMRGEAITTASDVYSLGVVLYELLTGHRPHRVKHLTLPELARAIAEAEPEKPSAAVNRVVTENDAEGNARVARSPETVSVTREGRPDRLRRRLAGDPDNIALMALRKDPHERYPSAAQLGEDIERHLAGRPVIARKHTVIYRTGKTIRRHKAGTIVAALLFIALIAGAVSLFQREKANRRIEYARQINQAAQEWANGNLPRMQELLDNWLPSRQSFWDREDLRGFEWYYLWRRRHRDQTSLQLNGERIWGVYFLSENLVFIHCTDENLAHLGPWAPVKHISIRDAVAGKLERYDIGPGQSFRFNERKSRLVVQEDEHTLKIRQMPDRTPIATFTSDSGFTVAELAADDKTLIAGDSIGRLKFWDIATAKELFSLKISDEPVTLFKATRDARNLVVQSDAHSVAIWDLANRRPVHTIREKEKVNLHFFFDANFFGISSEDYRTMKVYDTATARLAAVFNDPSPGVWKWAATVAPKFIFSFSRDTNTSVRVWSLSSGRLAADLKGHTDWVYDAKSFHNDEMLATVSSDRTIKLWDLTAFREINTIRGHTGEIHGLDVSPGERKLLSIEDGATIKIWDIAELLKPEALTGHDGVIYSVAISRDGKTVASAGADHTARVWDADKGLRFTLRGHAGEVLAVAISPDGRVVATGSKDGAAKLWDAATGKLLATYTGQASWVRAVAFSPDSRRLATGHQDGTIKLWEMATGGELTTLKGHTNEILSVAFSPDGRKLVSGSWDATAKIWALSTHREIATLKGHRDRVWSAKFSPDGTKVATAGGGTDWTIRLWNAATGRELNILKGHSNEIFCLDFTPDGKRLASASNDETIKVWNTENGLELLTLKDHTKQVWSVAFSGDGKTMVSGSWDKTARIWRALSQEDARHRVGK